jgi:hypothetical protein
MKAFRLPDNVIWVEFGVARMHEGVGTSRPRKRLRQRSARGLFRVQSRRENAPTDVGGYNLVVTIW